ncbi:MAG: TetR/AcrR family transcriptional regulator [Edaphobacter sp.]|jgi:TetR/AcrR family transcriptional regulator, transcriptional repressor for nem operon
MGVTKEMAAENRQKILAAAERLFREKGVDAVGLTELMKEAGFTQGGFYNHFKSKEALVSEVLRKAVEEGVQELSEAIASSQAKGLDPLTRQINWYLSPQQRDDIECGCAMAGFAGDIPRLTKEAQSSYAEALGRTFERIAEMIRFQKPALSKKDAHGRAIALYGQMVGSLLLSRAVSSGNPKLADEILKQTRAGIFAGLSRTVRDTDRRGK